jgi:hypothetical protein
MKRKLPIWLLGSLIVWGGLMKLVGQADFVTAPLGIIAGQAVGRVILDGSLNTEVLMYFPAIEGIGTNLFNGTPGVRTAFFTARSNKFSGLALVNANVGILTLAPGSERIVMNVYFNPNPDRDFSRPESFSDGQLVGVYPVSAGSTTLVEGANSTFVYSAQLDTSSEFTFRGRTFNGRNLLPAFSVFLNGSASFIPALQGGSGFVTPMAGVMIAANRSDASGSVAPY